MRALLAVATANPALSRSYAFVTKELLPRVLAVDIEEERPPSGVWNSSDHCAVRLTLSR